MIMTRLLAVLLAATLVGCTAMEATRDPASPFFVIPEGSMIELHQPLEIRPGTARIWLQRGRVAAGQDWYAPSCNLEIRTLDREHSQTVAPGSFVIRRVQQMEERVERPHPEVQLAAVGFSGGLRMGGYDDGGMMGMWRGYHLWLESEEQPDVLRMTCMGAFADPWEVRPPSLEDLRGIFGDIATLHLP
ncbi:hypothetical protein [Thioalkalivibrio sp.]|uniref:hypothetical protein n=1 Tax=Thioalkalivibrio sp. TaxID=2093813 RepID=UPI003974FBFC